MDEESGETRQLDDVTGVGRGESELDRLRVKQRAGSREKTKHVERNDQLFVARMMQVGER